MGTAWGGMKVRRRRQLHQVYLAENRPGFEAGFLRVGPQVGGLLLGVALLAGCAGLPGPGPDRPALAWFRLKAPGAERVSVVGTFNGWDPEAHRLQGPDPEGVWSLGLLLPPGRYRYMFVVNGDRWVTDPEAQAYEEDGFGGRNALLLHGP